MAPKTLNEKPRISPAIKTYISQTVAEVLNDPDFGLELTERTKKRLRKALQGKTKLISYQAVKREFNRK